MNNNLQLVLKSSTTEMSLNDHDAGIYIVPELDGLTGLPEIRTTSGVNAGYDGGWTSAQKFDARSIVIRGVIANDDKTEVERMRRELVALLAQGKNEQLELDFVTGTGRAYEVQVRTIACDMAMQRVLTQQEFMITLRADDPLIYDNSSAGEEATVNISGATGGFRIPFEIPLAIDAGSEETVVQNSGLESVAPTIKMYGALHNPKIINHTTNQAMQVEAELGFTEGAWTTPVDAPEGTNVSFEPEREAPIESAKLKGNTTQQTYTGKNLVYTSGKTDGGITATYNAATGETTISGKAQRSYAVFGTVEDVLPAGTYTFSIQSAAPCAVGVATRTSGGTREGRPISTGATKTTFTISEDSPRYDIYLTGLTANTTYSFTFKAMLESGSTATPFEPYTNGPAPNPDYPQAVQTVTGENVVKIWGKNLLYLSGLNATDNGVANTLNNDGSITCSGTVGSGWNGWTIMPYVPNSIQAGTYTLSIDHAINVGMNITFRDSSNTNIVAGNIPAGSTSATITLPRTAAKYSLWANGTTGTAISFTIKAQIELGSTATAYEPYQGQSYEVNLGKNLFDKDNANTLDAHVDGSTITANNASKLIYIPCLPNTAYTLSANSQSWNRGVYWASSVPTIGGTANWVGNFKSGASEKNITTGATAKYLVFRLWYSTSSSETLQQALDGLQIELGSTATTYAAYFEPIELCKIGTYQDYIYKSGGKWYVRKETGKRTYTADDITIAANDAYSNVRYAQFPKGTDNKQYGNYTYGDIINFFTHGINMGAVPAGGWNSYISDGLIYNSAMQDNYWCSFSKSTVLATMKEKLNGMVAYYVLATPTDTEITNEALVAQLEALVDGNAVVYEGETHIAVTAAEGNMPGITAIRYYTDKEPDQRDELIIDSRLKTITLNGLDVYHLKTEGSEFPMLAPGENRLALQSDITGDNGYAQVSYKQGYLSI